MLAYVYPASDFAYSRQEMYERLDRLLCSQTRLNTFIPGDNDERFSFTSINNLHIPHHIKTTKCSFSIGHWLHNETKVLFQLIYLACTVNNASVQIHSCNDVLCGSRTYHVFVLCNAYDVRIIR